MLSSSVAFAREIRRMETEEVKRLTFPQMLALAVFETRTILDDLRHDEIVSVMESLPEGGSRKRARNRMSPSGIRWGDHGTQSRKGVAEWRGMTGHAAKVRAHRKHVAKVRKREQSYAQLAANPIGGFIGNNE